VIDRAVALLDELAADSRAMSLAALSMGSGLSKTTVRRVLTSLEQHGFCERTPTGEYRLGLRLFALGTLVRERLDLRERSRPALEWLAEKTHLTVFLCIRDADRAICIDRVDGRFAHTLALRLGGTQPLHAGASPLVLLSYTSDEDVERYLAKAGGLEKFTARTLTSRAAVRRAVLVCRDQGFVLSNEDVTDGVAGIGAPVFDHGGAVVAAVSLSGLTPHVLSANESRLIEDVRTAATRISRELGFSGKAVPSWSNPEHPATAVGKSKVPQTLV
jgi:DNA-binding IclR family transcriptional regulator